MQRDLTSVDALGSGVVVVSGTLLDEVSGVLVPESLARCA
jgi:hypothetical protein